MFVKRLTRSLYAIGSPWAWRVSKANELKLHLRNFVNINTSIFKFLFIVGGNGERMCLLDVLDSLDILEVV